MSVTISYLHNGTVQLTDVRDLLGHALTAIRHTLRRQGITAPVGLDTLSIGETLELGGGLAVRVTETDLADLWDATEGALSDEEARCDQCGSKLPATRHCTNCR